MRMRISALCLVALMLYACDQRNESDAAKESAESDSDHISEAVNSLEDQTYEEAIGSANCTDDCSGHNAGWDWAKKHEIVDPDNCSGDSDSFIEGCKAYGEEIQRLVDEARDDADSNN